MEIHEEFQSEHKTKDVSGLYGFYTNSMAEEFVELPFNLEKCAKSLFSAEVPKIARNPKISDFSPPSDTKVEDDVI